MYKPDTLTRRGSLRSLRSAPLLSTVLESTLSLTRIHPIASLELPGLDYAVQSQSHIGAYHHRELGTSLRSGIAAITAASGAAGGLSQSQSALLGRYGPGASIRNNERKIVQPKRVLSRKLKPHLVADTVKQYISRAQRTAKKGSEEQQNMEFLRGVYAFMQVSRSSVDYSNDNGNGNGSGYEATLSLVNDANATAVSTTPMTTRDAGAASITTTTTATKVTRVQRKQLLAGVAEDNNQEAAATKAKEARAALRLANTSARVELQPENKSQNHSQSQSQNQNQRDIYSQRRLNQREKLHLNLKMRPAIATRTTTDS